MPKFLAIAGFHNSGKTTVGTYLVSKLLERGYKVGVIKTTKETTEETDKQDSDTFKYRKAGAKQVVLFQRDRMTLFVEDIPMDKSKVFSIFERLFFGYDLVIMEGFKGWPEIPKIWIKKDDEDVLVEGVENLLMVADAREREKILNFVENYIKEGPAKEIKVLVNDEVVPLKPHLQLLFQNLWFGILSSLKGVPQLEDIKTVKVFIKR